MSPNLLEWVKVGRIHTASLTMPLALIGYVYGGGDDPVKGFLWLLFGLVFHYSGFLQNNVHDYPYDLKDPNKQHFPLVRGVIKLRHAFIVAYSGLIGVSAIPLMLGGLPSFTAYILGVFIPGTAYNLFSKKTLLKPIPISICFPMIPLTSYLSASSRLDTPITALIAAFVTLFAYQIAFSGELKDIEREEKNILRKIGSVKGVVAFAAALKALNIAAAAYLFSILWDGNPAVLAAFTLTTIAILETLYMQVRDYLSYVGGNMDRNRALRNMSFMEVLSYTMVVVASSTVLGHIYTPLWVILPIAWFIAMNRVIFGTRLFPRV